MDKVNHPLHYKHFSFEVIDFIDELMQRMHNKNIDFYMGNVAKYILRSKFKDNELQDLQKAKWYFKRAKKHLETIPPLCFELENLQKYLSEISRFDFDLYILLVDVVNFAVFSNLQNYETAEKRFEIYIKKLQKESKWEIALKRCVN